MALSLREVDVFKPYSDEFPYELFAQLGLSESRYGLCVAADFVRVAKLASEVIGAYALQAETAGRYTLHAVVVASSQRKQGLGRWLVGHAIGISESKGGRVVYLPHSTQSRFFGHIGFVKDGAGQRYDLVPE